MVPVRRSARLQPSAPDVGFRTDDAIGVALVCRGCVRVDGSGSIGDHGCRDASPFPSQRQLLNRRTARRAEPDDHRLRTITWRNIAAKPASELQFHLYWNAWKNARTTFMRERALAGGGAEPQSEDWSRIDVTSIKLVAPSAAGVGDLTASKRFIQPDDGNADDETVMAVPLPRAVPPGAAVALEVKWSAHVPRTFARTGAIGNYFFVAQWFPKLGVWQDEGWNCHQFHASTEFFSDYGVYDVLLTVPRSWTVGATGVERDRRKNADNTKPIVTTRKTSTISRGRRVRIMWSRPPASRSAAFRRSRCGSCCSPSTSIRPSVTSTRPGRH